MTIRRALYLTCNLCGRPSPFVSRYVFRARKEARRLGWFTSPELDLCPKHRQYVNVLVEKDR